MKDRKAGEDLWRLLHQDEYTEMFGVCSPKRCCLRTISSPTSLLFYFLCHKTTEKFTSTKTGVLFSSQFKSLLFVTVGAPARCREGRQRRRTQAQKITDAVERWILLAVKWPRPGRRSHFCPFCVGGGSVFGTWPLKTMRNLPKGRCWQL